MAFDPFQNFEDLTTLGLSTSSISAFFLSFYNYFKAKTGAVIKLSTSYKFGIFTFQSGRKLMYFPLDILNTGNRIGKVDIIKIEITSPRGDTTTMFPKRRVETDVGIASSKLNKDNLKETIPTLPVFCSPGEGSSVLFEYYEESSEDRIIQQEEIYEGKVSIIYNNKKKDSMKFKFKISENEWNQSGNAITWVHFMYK